ncbi:MAG: ribbon-helix-helix domain-containing protein [Ignisphaera sp.]
MKTKMKIVSVKIPDQYIEAMDELIKKGRYVSRSEVIRTALRELLKRELWSSRSHEMRKRDPRIKVIDLG